MYQVFPLKYKIKSLGGYITNEQNGGQVEIYIKIKYKSRSLQVEEDDVREIWKHYFQDLYMLIQRDESRPIWGVLLKLEGVIISDDKLGMSEEAQEWQSSRLEMKL